MAFGVTPVSDGGPAVIPPGPVVNPPPQRSGSKMGSATHCTGTTSGIHFGHHKALSKFLKVAFHLAAPGIVMAQTTDEPVPFLPELTAFFETSADVRSTVGRVVQVNGGPSGVNIMITGTYPEGHRSKVNTTDSYTHIALVDPQISVKDQYTGQGQALNNNPDAFLIPAGQTSNKWMAVFSFVTLIPGIGRKKVVFLDRWGTPGDWTTLV